MKHHATTLIPNLLSPSQTASLQALTKEFKRLNSNLADTKVTQPRHEHIGEAVQIGSAEKPCPHPYMIPSLDKKSCILANRIDIGKHYLTTGGTLAAR